MQGFIEDYLVMIDNALDYEEMENIQLHIEREGKVTLPEYNLLRDYITARSKVKAGCKTMFEIKEKLKNGKYKTIPAQS